MKNSRWSILDMVTVGNWSTNYAWNWQWTHLGAFAVEESSLVAVAGVDTIEEVVH
jgi:hypothetical protein